MDLHSTSPLLSWSLEEAFNILLSGHCNELRASNQVLAPWKGASVRGAPVLSVWCHSAYRSAPGTTGEGDESIRDVPNASLPNLVMKKILPCSF